MPPSDRPADWTELTALVDTLLDAPPHERQALIDALSAGDPVRHAELAALLAECEREPPLLSVPATERFNELFADDLRFPDALAARYRLTSELGRGGMATVYLAHDEKHGRDVAVKVVHPALAAALGAERFLREIEIVAQLHHPHIVPLYDSGEADGALYFVMPYEAGLSLRQRIARDSPLAIGEVVTILRDVCDALAYAHAHGIVHRDIKPDNVLLSGRHALVADFGIAKAAAEARALPSASPSDESQSASLSAGLTSGALIGTPAYMAPEQIAGDDEAIDQRADLYAVGVLGYELLVGRPPFTGDARREILASQLRDAPPEIDKQRADVPPRLAALIMKCLAKRPADRWQSANELLHELESSPGAGDVVARSATPRRRWLVAGVSLGVVAVGAALLIARRGAYPSEDWRNRWSRAHVEKVTDFAGSQVDAAISPDGQSVAFLADRDSVFDAFVSRIGSGRFSNLTGGKLRDLFNEDVRNIGFTPDGARVWIRVADLTAPASVSLLPTTGGPLTPFLPTAVMVVWSPDGSLLAYHETTPGDPIFVADSDGRNSRQIYISPGLHSHYLSWSPDGRFLYFSHGLPPNDMDVWRIAATGGDPVRITTHDSHVGYPVLLDDRTLLYTATDDEGAGPWLYMMDLEERVPTRLSAGVEHFVSIAASADLLNRPRRLVATVSNPSVQLWTVPLTAGIATERLVGRVSVPTARSAAPRFAHDGSLLYLASRGGSDGLWRLGTQGAAELWRPDVGAVTDAAAVAPNGDDICFVVRNAGRSTLQCTAGKGGAVRHLADSLDVRGAPSWSPDGKWIAIAAKSAMGLQVFKVPVAGGPPVQLLDSMSFEPVWSPDGRFILYSGTTRGRSAPLKAMTPDGKPFALPFPSLVVDRLSDSYRFLPNGGGLVVKLGGFRRQDFWLFDLATGSRRQLTQLRTGESLRRFDISPDGKRIIFERVRENSDIALIELPNR